MSHLSIESLSQIYNHNLRLKFGSAPAQLLTKGEQAEKSLEKRASAIKKQFDTSNLVTTKSQMTNHISKQAMQGTVSATSWNKYDPESKSREEVYEKEEKNKKNEKKKTKVNNSKKYENQEDSSDDDNKVVVKLDKKIRANFSPQSSGRSSHMSSRNSVVN
jgi:hypothetical protein